MTKLTKAGKNIVPPIKQEHYLICNL